MSQSATLYRISKDIFTELKNSDERKDFDISSISTSYSVFQGTFMAIEFILSKGQNELTIALVSEIFNPKKSLGKEGFENLTADEQLKFYEDCFIIYYLDNETVFKLNQFLTQVSISEIKEKYSSKELNINGIYPDVWHDNNSFEEVFNERHIIEDVTELKNIFSQAAKENDYILVFVG